jgi:DNA-binding PadR family transcriptional regulator
MTSRDRIDPSGRIPRRPSRPTAELAESVTTPWFFSFEPGREGMKQSKMADMGVLCMLNEEPGLTKSELQERLRHNFGRYWGAGTSVVWSATDRLNEEGLIESDVEAAGNEPPAFAITDAGRERLESLILEPVEDLFHPMQRPMLMMKLGSLHHLPEGDQGRIVDRLREEALEARDHIETVRHSHDEAIDDHERYGYRRDLLDLRLRLVDEILDWLEGIQPE